MLNKKAVIVCHQLEVHDDFGEVLHSNNYRFLVYYNMHIFSDLNKYLL